MRRKSWSTDFEKMEDIAPLIDDEEEIHRCVGRDDRDLESSRESGTDRLHGPPPNDKKIFWYILAMGMAFMLIFTAFNTNGIISVSAVRLSMWTSLFSCFFFIKLHGNFNYTSDIFL